MKPNQPFDNGVDADADADAVDAVDAWAPHRSGRSGIGFTKGETSTIAQTPWVCPALPSKLLFHAPFTALNTCILLFAIPTTIHDSSKLRVVTTESSAERCLARRTPAVSQFVSVR